MLELYTIRPLQWKTCGGDSETATGSEVIYLVWRKPGTLLGLLQISSPGREKELVFDSVLEAKAAATRHHRDAMLLWLARFSPAEWTCTVKGESQ